MFILIKVVTKTAVINIIIIIDQYTEMNELLEQMDC